MSISDFKKKRLSFLDNVLRTIWKRKKEISKVSLIGYAILVLTFLLQVVIARFLGTEQFGVYSATLAMVALVEVPLILRANEVSMRILGNVWRNSGPSAMRSVARQMVRYDLRVCLTGFIILIFIVWAIHRQFEIDFWLFFILAFIIPAQIGFGILKSYFLIFDKIVDMVWFEFIYAVILVCLNLSGLFVWGMYGLAISLVVAMLVKTYLAFKFTKKYLPMAGNRTPCDYQDKSETEEGIVSILRNIFSNGLNQVDIIILSQLQKPEIVAFYKVGKGLSSLPIKIAFPVWRYLQPKLLEAVQNGEVKKEKKVILAGSFILIAVMLFLLPPIVLFGEEVLVFFYGEVYREAFEHFLILLAGVWVFHGISGWFKFWVVVTHARLFGVLIYMGGFSAMILFGIAYGASSAVAMGYVVSSILILTSIIAFAKVFSR